MRRTNQRLLRLGAVLVAAMMLLVVGMRLRLDWIGALYSPECGSALCCEDCQALQVTRVIDGDTFDTPVGRVRLYGVDTPERNEFCYQQAADRLRALAGSSVRVEPGERPTDPNGRLLYYVYTRRGESIDESLVREGVALAWTRDGQHRDMLVELEAEAHRHHTGCLWQQ